MHSKSSRTYRKGSILAVESWQPADRDAWRGANSLAAVFGTGPSTKHLSKATLDMNERGFGKYLAYLSTIESYNRPICESGVTRLKVQGYLRELEAANYSLASQHKYLTTLLYVHKVLRPKDDVSWLEALVRTIPQSAFQARERPLPTSDQVWDLGIGLIHEALEKAAREPLAPRPLRAIQAGLILAILAARSMRRGQFLNLTLGRTLFKDGESYRVGVPAKEAKNRKAYRTIFPTELAPYLDAYFSDWYPAQFRNELFRPLWIMANGEHFSASLLNKIIAEETERAFGTALSPNDLRRVTTTSAALIDPALVNIAAAVNGHSDPRVIRRHYDRSKGLGSQRRYAAQMADLRQVYLVKRDLDR
jgi:integrase